MSLYDAIQKAISWATVSQPQDGNGLVQVDAGGKRPLERILQLGLPGMYAIARAGVNGVLFRLLTNGVFFAADTKPPSDSVVEEIGWFNGTAIARLVPTHIFEVKATRTGFAVPATGVLTGGGISLGARDLTDGPILQVARSMDSVVTPLGVSVGVCMGTTIRVGAA